MNADSGIPNMESIFALHLAQIARRGAGLTGALGDSTTGLEA